jgi:hypothetical protein
MLAIPVSGADACAARDGALLGLDEQFLELMCADEELLQAEFDAIIAEEWPDSSPPTDLPAESSGDSSRPSGPRLTRAGPTTPRRPHHPGTDGWSRQRSPPTRTRAHDQRTKARDQRTKTMD